MTIKKFMLISFLTLVICIMSLGYAALNEKIDITGSSSIDSIYRVEITKVERTSLTGSATEKDIPSYTGLNANFNVGLTEKIDTITYDITISNLGTVDVKLNNNTITTDGNKKITAIKTGVNNGDIILAGESKTLTLKIKYDGEIEENEITGTVKINFDYTRLKGGNEQIVEEKSLAYLRADVVTFAGSNWYVIEDSPANQDYVTLMKETMLTKEELGEYAATLRKTCTADDVTKGTNGCTIEGETVTVEYATMAYYWSDMCHYSSVIYLTDIYDSNAMTGCNGHNDYEGSKVREFLEGTYINTLGSENLKEIDGYKIRLLKVSEISEEFTAEYTPSTSLSLSNLENVPTFIYQNFQGETNAHVYWTMTPNSSASSSVWYIQSNGGLSSGSLANYFSRGVRPVINLLKTSI